MRSWCEGLSCEPCACEDVRFASWGSFGGELPGLDDPCMAAAARAMSSKLVVARPLYDTVRVLVRSLGHVSAVTAMALQPPSPPTFQEALKNDRAQFEDCTPCRIVGTALPRRYELPDPVLIHTQEAQRSLASAPLPMSRVIRKSRPMKRRYEPAKACSA